ncbi:MAG: DUF308 domain-containing protein [Clostridia bacterium]|nr:DUF308 domain-containing protein [Clostridia bacterium]
MAAKRSINWEELLTAAVYILIGILFIVLKRDFLNLILTVAGVLFIVLGIINVIRGDLIPGIIDIAIGAIIILGGWLFVEIILIVFGVLLVVKGVMDFLAAYKPFSFWGVLLAVLTAVFGVLLIVEKWVIVDWYYIILGVIFVISGTISLVGTLLGKKR